MTKQLLEKPKPSVRAQMWKVLRESKIPLSRREISSKIGIDTKKCEHQYLNCLVGAGFVERLEGKPARWKLVRDGGVEAPRFKADGTLIIASGSHEAIWRAMRILKTFTLTELYGYVSALASFDTVKSYVVMLNKVGYLRSARKPNCKAVYTLIKNTGPKPPQIMKVKEVYDPNVDEIILRDVPDYE